MQKKGSMEGQFMAEKKKKFVITIGRQYGAGGKAVGKALAEELGVHFYDEEILKITSETSAIGEPRLQALIDVAQRLADLFPVQFQALCGIERGDPMDREPEQCVDA